MLEVIAKRKSTRTYFDQPVEKERLLQLIESARVAPSAINSQPWHFVIVTSEKAKKKILEFIPTQDWMKHAPAFVVAIADIKIKDDSVTFVDETSDHPELKGIIRDTSIATEHILLEAQNLGLSSCWTGWFSQADIRPALDIPEDKFVVGLIALGYSDDKDKLPNHNRRPLENMVHYDKW